jgi:dCTP deaminase
MPRKSKLLPETDVKITRNLAKSFLIWNLSIMIILYILTNIVLIGHKMTILGKSEILKLQRQFRILWPFNDRLLDGDGYILTVNQSVVLNYLEHKNLTSKEIVMLPTNIVAHLTAKSRFGRLGLSFLNAAKVHSGFIGRLALEVVNLSNERTPITIKRNDPFMHIEFIQRSGEPEPYDGEYQFQFMTEYEIKEALPYIRNIMPDFSTYWEKIKKRSKALGKTKLSSLLTDNT